MRRFGIGVLLVPLRDTETGRFLPGVTAQDLGPKMGRNGLDNGILSFSHVRVPASALLSRFMTVSASAGTVQPSPLAQLAYAALVDGRALMAHASFGMLSMALTIAVRYGARRRQFPLAAGRDAAAPGSLALAGTASPSLSLPRGVTRLGLATALAAETAPAPWVTARLAPASGRVLPAPGVAASTGTGERAILDYPLHLARLVPLTGLCYMLKGAADRVSQLCKDAAVALDRKDIATLKRAHCVSAALKAEATWLAYEGIDACRQACGGFGYSSWSGLPALVTDFAVMPTWEGDNHLMALQGSRLVINALRGMQAGKKPAPEVAFVAAPEGADAVTVDAILSAFEEFQRLPQAQSGHTTSGATADECGAVVEACGRVLSAAQAGLEQSATAMATGALSSIGGAMAEGGSAGAGREGERQSLALVAVGRLWMRGWLVAAGKEWVQQQLVLPSSSVQDLAAAAAVSRATVATALWLVEKSAAWLAPACTDGSDVTALATAVVDASSGVRCDVLGLVEAYGHSDWVLASKLGKAHSDPYTEWIGAATTSRASGGEPDYWAGTVGEVLRTAPGGAITQKELY
jgi:alkylation response protein AidB-like acyl-CoA dehydrogenase